MILTGEKRCTGGGDLFQAHLVYQKFHMEWYWFGRDLPRGDTGDWPSRLHLVSLAEWVLLYVMMEVKIATETSFLF